ncbi:MAG: hypothetical protein QW795_06565 [Candidatus Bathyarchaeia archaeon]
MKMYRMHQTKIYLNEKAIIKLLNVNRLDSVVYDLNVILRRKEFKNIRNNCVIYRKDGEVYFVPLSYFIVDGLNDIDVNYYIEELKRVVKELSMCKNRIGKIEKYEKIDELIGIKEIGIERHFRFIVGFGLFMEKLEKFVNRYVIENVKLPNSEEIKEFIISYMKSFDLENVFDGCINKIKLLVVK